MSPHIVLHIAVESEMFCEARNRNKVPRLEELAKKYSWQRKEGSVVHTTPHNYHHHHLEEQQQQLYLMSAKLETRRN